MTEVYRAAFSALLLALGAGGVQAQTVYTQVAAGGEHTCALVKGGTVQCWGANDFGQLGNGSTYHDNPLAYMTRSATGQPSIGSNTPEAVNGLTGVTAIGAGSKHTCAVIGGGAVKCWGNNKYGQLGDGGTADSNLPVTVQGLTGATALGAGYGWTCALLGDGTVKCWGENGLGQLGNGAKTNSGVPVAVQGLAGVTAIGAGSHHACALVSGGAVKCWGGGLFGTLGDGAQTNSNTPVAVDGLTGASAIGLGGSHTCALLGDGVVKCWGRNLFNALGNNSRQTASHTPVAVAGLRGASAISAGYGHTCALISGGAVQCWGDNSNSQLGEGTLTSATAVSAGGSHTCALRGEGSIWCWGRNFEGQLGDGATQAPGTPSRATAAIVIQPRLVRETR
jgi:alpha-tubulin suppressor-like RCC1 family protein